MRWLRKATGHFRAVAEDRMCDEEVRITYEVPSTRSLFLLRRLMYLASFRKASLFLRARLQHGGRLHPWVQMIQEDLAGLQMLEPKLSGLPPPHLDIDARVRFACDHPGAWRRLLRVLRSPSDPDGLPSIDIECPICTKVVSARGLGSHCAKRHQFVRLARFYCDDSGLCPVCLTQFPSRLRRMHHIHHSKPECLRQLRSGDFAPIDPVRVLVYDAADAKLRLTARTAGVPYLTISVVGTCFALGSAADLSKRN